MKQAQPFDVSSCVMIKEGDIKPRLWKTLGDALEKVARLKSHKEYDYVILVFEKSDKPEGSSSEEIGKR